MTVTVQFACSGCDRVAQGTEPLKRRFISLNGSGHGFGTWQEAPASSVAPKGWVAFDPVTNITYCPTCWASIVAPHGEEPDP
jgi:hypothetical protein